MKRALALLVVLLLSAGMHPVIVGEQVRVTAICFEIEDTKELARLSITGTAEDYLKYAEAEDNTCLDIRAHLGANARFNATLVREVERFSYGSVVVAIILVTSVSAVEAFTWHIVERKA